ncbi:MAG: hypothetical protein ACPGVG_20645, partial [Mycobacterium sp.]
RFKYSSLGGSIVDLHEIEAANRNAQGKASRAAERVYQAGAAVDAANERTQDIGGAILDFVPYGGTALAALLGIGATNKARTGSA